MKTIEFYKNKKLSEVHKLKNLLREMHLVSHKNNQKEIGSAENSPDNTDPMAPQKA